jgi:hypothetical protein
MNSSNAFTQGIKTMEGLRPSFSAHVSWREHGAPRQVLFGPLGFGGPQLRFPHTLYPIVFSSLNGKTCRALIQNMSFSATCKSPSFLDLYGTMKRLKAICPVSRHDFRGCRKTDALYQGTIVVVPLGLKNDGLLAPAAADLFSKLLGQGLNDLAPAKRIP